VGFEDLAPDWGGIPVSSDSSHEWVAQVSILRRGFTAGAERIKINNYGLAPQAGGADGELESDPVVNTCWACPLLMR
jgi:hypothetical protein